MIGKRFERTVYMRTTWRGDENQIGMTGGEIDTGGRTGRRHQRRAAEGGLRRDPAIVDRPGIELAFIGEVFGFAPQAMKHIEQFSGHIVTLVMVDALPAEHFMLNGAVAGDDVDAPSSSSNVIQRRAIFGEMQRMQRPIKHMDGGDQQNALRDRRHGAERNEAVERGFAIITTLGQPLRSAESNFETKLFRTLHQFDVVIEGPAVAGRQAGEIDVLQIEEQAQHQRLLYRAAERAVLEIGRAFQFKTFQLGTFGQWNSQRHVFSPSELPPCGAVAARRARR
ncbi:hypothetical protein D3C71_854900 [compost metagenome]